MSAITVTPTVEPSTGPGDPPRIKLDVTDSGSPNLFAATVVRNDPDGRQVPVRTADGNPLVLSTSGTDRIGLVFDYEPPFGQAVTYSTLEDPATVSASVTLDELLVWLIHPGIPVLSMPILVASLGARTRKVQRGVYSPLGRKYPVIVTDGTRKAAEYQLTLHSLSDEDSDRLEALLEDAGTVLLNVPVSKGWRVTHEYVAVGDLEEERSFRVASNPTRTWTLPCTVVDRPAGGSQSERTYVDLLDFASYTELQSAYPTYAAVLAGP